MALIPIKLSKRGRSSGTLLSFVLIIVEDICGIICLCTGFYIFYYIGNGLYSYSKSLINYLFIFLVVSSIFIFIISLVGFKYMRNLSAQPTNHSTARIHWIWLYFSITLVGIELAFILVLSNIAEQLIISIDLTLNHGLTHYYSDTSWKSMMDHLQQSFQCCGIQQYTDWYRTSWLSSNKLPQDPDILDKYALANSLVIVPLVPSSCCKSSSTPCGEKALSGNKSTTSWNEITPTDPATIHTRGCHPLLLTALNSSLVVVSVVIIVIIVLQCFVIIISRYVFTSTRNTIVMGSPSGSAVGWLWGVGDLFFTWGKTLPEHDSEIFKDIRLIGEKRSICNPPGCLGNLFKNKNEQDKIESNEKGPDEPENELTDEENKSSKLMTNFKKILRKSKDKANSLKKSGQLSNLEAKPLLIAQSGDETDLTDNEMKLLNEDEQISEKFQSRYLKSQRRDDALEIISLGQKALDMSEECTECDEYAFGTDNIQNKKQIPNDENKGIKTQSMNEGNADKKGSKSKKKADNNSPSLPLPPVIYPDLNKKIDKKAGNKNNQEVYFSLIQNNLEQLNSPKTKERIKNEASIWPAMTKVVENFNVQTQTSRVKFKQDKKEVSHKKDINNQSEPVKVKDSCSVVFRNYKIPQKKKIDSKEIPDQWQKTVDNPEPKVKDKDSDTIVFRNYRIPPKKPK